MSDNLPEELCYCILLHVPAKPLLCFRSVCKTWRRIIDDIDFIKTHVKLHQQQECGDLIVIRNNAGGKLYSLPLSSLDPKSKSITLTNIKNLAGFGVPKIKTFPVPSHSGMVLITKESRDEERKTWMLWNPFTQDSFVLPSHTHLINGIDSGEKAPRNGIGYDSKTDDFKVVRLLQLWGPENSCKLETLVYSLKLNTWKRIINFQDCRQPRPGWNNGVFVNGALHWRVDVVAQGQWSESIIAFDLSTEEDHMLPYPSLLLTLPRQYLSDFFLDVLGGFLCLRNHCGVWIMEDYEKKVWTKLVSSTHLCPWGKPIVYIKSRGQILFQNHNEYVLFDVDKKCGKKLNIEGLPGIFTSQVFSLSLFRLTTSGGGDDDEGSIALNKTLKRKRSAVNNRSKVQLKITEVDDPPSRF